MKLYLKKLKCFKIFGEKKLNLIFFEWFNNLWLLELVRNIVCFISLYFFIFLLLILILFLMRDKIVIFVFFLISLLIWLIIKVLDGSGKLFR